MKTPSNNCRQTLGRWEPTQLKNEAFDPAPDKPAVEVLPRADLINETGDHWLLCRHNKILPPGTLISERWTWHAGRKRWVRVGVIPSAFMSPRQVADAGYRYAGVFVPKEVILDVLRNTAKAEGWGAATTLGWRIKYLRLSG